LYLRAVAVALLGLNTPVYPPAQTKREIEMPVESIILKCITQTALGLVLKVLRVVEVEEKGQQYHKDQEVRFPYRAVVAGAGLIQILQSLHHYRISSVL